MIFRTIIGAIAICGASLGAVSAQSLADVETEATYEMPAETAPLIPNVDLAAWKDFATAVEADVESDDRTASELSETRSELVIWRDLFFDGLDVNEARLATLAKQIAAIAPAEGEVLADPVLQNRMSDLLADKERLSRPYILANEGYVHATGLISEVDAQIRNREALRLATRNPSPANPANWGDAKLAIGGFAAVLHAETARTSTALLRDGKFWSRLLIAAVSTLVALFFVMRIRKWVSALKDLTITKSPRSAFIYRFVLSLASLVLPIIGLSILSAILIYAGFWGLRGKGLIRAIPIAGGFIFAAKWLSDWYFPTALMNDGLLGYDRATRANGRLLVALIGWTLAVGTFVVTALEMARASDLASEVIGLPLQIVIGFLMWRLGALIARDARAESDADFKQNRIRKFVSPLVQSFAVLGPLASVLGYAAAAQSITGPAVLSLALFATLIVFQRLSFALASPAETPAAQDVLDDAMIDDAPVIEPDTTGLLSLLINTGLTLACLPLLALIWGASAANLVDVWTRFRVGFNVGDITVSPSSFVTFVVVLVLGYLLTGGLKTTLKTSVLPRTRLDIGGQNAVVAGTGYVGISLSALAAFTIAGIDLSSLAIVAGALSVGIGFGLQNIVQNFVAGIILLIERPVSEGDMIEVGGQMGYVRDISVRSTRIETFDRRDVIVPNADLISNQVTNWTRGNSIGRATIPVGVAYGSDTKRVAEILQEVAEANPLVLLNPPPNVLLMQFGADSIDFEIRAIIRDVNFVMVVKSEILHEIVARFNAAGIEIPFAQRDIWLRNPEALHPKGEQT